MRLAQTVSLPESKAMRIREVTLAIGQFATDDLVAVMRRDKKAVGGKMRFILPTRIGEVKLYDDVPEALVRAVLEGQ